MEELRKIANDLKLEKEIQKMQELQKTVQHIEKPFEAETESPFVSELEKQLKAEKAMQYIEKVQAQNDTAAKIAERMNALKEKYITLEAEKISSMAQHNKDKLELPPNEYRAELMEEHAENIVALQVRLEQLRESRQNLRLLELKKKKEADEKIALATQELGRAQDFFKNRFNTDPSQAREELKRLQEEIRAKKKALKAKQSIIDTIRQKQEALELEYHTQKLLNDTRPDQEQITQLLEQSRTPSESVREQQLRERIDLQLNVISDYYFDRAIANLPQHQAQILTNLREEAKEREALLRFEREQDFLTRYYATQDKKERERMLRAEDERRNRAFDRGR